MEEERTTTAANEGQGELRSVIRSVIDEFMRAEQVRSEPAYKTELVEERRRREQLEQRVNELAGENKVNKQIAEEAEKQAAVRAELQRLGVAKVDLAFRAVRGEIRRKEDGRLMATADSGEMPFREYLAQFINENPELLPARIAGGSGMEPVQKAAPAERGIDLDKIKPGMDPEELDRVRKEISRVAAQTLRGF
jgi:hypothetical protein